MRKPIAIIQARYGSTRLQGKVLKRVCGKTLLVHQIERMRRARELGGIIVATTIERKDDRVARLVKRMKVACFRGSENDVLDRYYQAAKHFQINDIVRITGDCPLLDPLVIDLVIRFYKKNRKKFNYVSNARPPTFPDGMDVDVFSFYALQEAWEKARLPSEREHVTPYIANRFGWRNFEYQQDFSFLRLTVDESRDLILIRKIFLELYPQKPDFTLSDIIKLFQKKPNLFSINSNIPRNEGYAKSLLEDRYVINNTS